MTRRVVVTGIGMVTPVGNDRPSTWEAVCAGRSGVRPIERWDPSELTTHFAGQVIDFDPTVALDRKTAKRTDRLVHYAAAAAVEALRDAKFTIDEDNADDIGVLMGTGAGGMETLHEEYGVFYSEGPSRVSPFFIPRFMPNDASGVVSILTGARGPTFAIASACATGADSLGEAAEIIRRGSAVAMIAGGTESGVTPMAMAAFGAMHAMSRRNDDPTRASRPFDATRDGFVLSEGAGVFLLEDEEHAKARGAHIYAELAGYAATADAHHIVEPAPGGAGLARAIRKALAHAGVKPEEVGYINAHGTATPYNDAAETKAIHAAFGEHAKKLAISSTKSMIGHTFGAAGAIEAGVTVLALDTGILPPTINLEHPDPECDLDYIPNEARKQHVNVAISESMGFGGHNAVLVFRRLAAE